MFMANAGQHTMQITIHGSDGCLRCKTIWANDNSKNFPKDPWSIPQTPNQQFMKEFLNHLGVLGMFGVCSTGVCWGSLRTVHQKKPSRCSWLMGSCRDSRLSWINEKPRMQPQLIFGCVFFLCVCVRVLWLVKRIYNQLRVSSKWVQTKTGTRLAWPTSFRMA